MEKIQNEPLNPCEEVLAHHGILNMKWGIRRYQPYPKGYKGEGKFVGKLSTWGERRQARHKAKTNTRIKNAVETGDKKKLKKYKDEMTPEEYEKKYAETVKNGIDNAVKDRDKDALKKYKEDLNKRDYKHQKDRIEFKEAIDDDNSRKTKKLLSKVDPEDVREATDLIRSRVALQDQKLSKIRQDSELMARLDKMNSGLSKISKTASNISSIGQSFANVNKTMTEFSKAQKDAEDAKKKKEIEKIIKSGDLDKIRDNQKRMNNQQLQEAYDRVIQIGSEADIKKAAPYMNNKQVTAAVQKLSQLEKLGSTRSSTPETTTVSDATRNGTVQIVRDWLDNGVQTELSSRSNIADVRRRLNVDVNLPFTYQENGTNFHFSHSDDISYEDVLAHHGILGMKWGIRRYQNPDGTLTPRGRKRLERERKFAVRTAEMAINDRESWKKYREKKADKIASKYADNDGNFKITKPKHAEKHFKLQEQIVEDEKALKKLRSSLKQLKEMKFDEMDSKNIDNAKSKIDNMIKENRHVYDAHMAAIMAHQNQIQHQVIQNQLLNQQLMNQHFMDMVNLQNINQTINASMMNMSMMGF